MIHAHEMWTWCASTLLITCCSTTKQGLGCIGDLGAATSLMKAQ
jgi:hypothetical protein